MEARRAHNPEVVGSSPASATKENTTRLGGVFFGYEERFQPTSGFPEGSEPTAAGNAGKKIACGVIRKMR